MQLSSLSASDASSLFWEPDAEVCAMDKSKNWGILSWVCILAFAAFGIWWNVRLPTVGKGGLFLAAVAVLMPLFWEKIGVVGKMSWVAMLFVLLAVEYRAIDKDRHDFADAEAYKRKEEKQQFSNIGESITTNVKKLLDHSDQQFKETVAQQSLHFDATMKQAQVNSDEVTGGDSYVIVYPNLTPSKSQTFHLFIRLCDRCQYSVSNARIHVQTDINSNEEGQLIYNGDVDPHIALMLDKVTITPAPNGESLYRIGVLARNKPTWETLKVRFNAQSQQWECSWHIERQEKQPHYNPKTKMAEGEILKVLEDSPWGTNALTPINPAKTKTIH
jgi:hypothetical protein